MIPNGMKLGGFYHNTGEGGISKFHKEPGGDICWNVGTGYFGCGSGTSMCVYMFVYMCTMYTVYTVYGLHVYSLHVYGVRSTRCTVYGVWCTVYGVRCTVYGVWCTAHGSYFGRAESLF